MTITIIIPQIVINISNTQTLNLEQMAHSIDDLLAEVAEAQTLADGVKATIAGLRQKVKDAIDNAGAGISDAELAAIQAKVDETFVKLAASNDEVAAALTENTDGGTTTPPVVPPVVDTPAPTTTGTTPPVVDTPAPVDTTPAPADGGTTAPVDVPATPVVDAPAPVDAPATPTTPGAPVDAGTPAAPTGPVTNPDGSTVI